MCEAVAGAMDADGTTTLADISSQVTAKVACEESTIESYVSTESLLPDKGGRQTASALPATGKVTVYQPGDTLVSNIRSYFKKVWYADREGTCSGDVIVFRAKDPHLAPYLYSVLRSDGFFEHVMAGAKGTKMPRGDKKQMMQYPVANDCDEDDLEILASMLDQISANNRENARLSELRDTLLPKLMSGEIDVSEIELPTQPNNHLAGLPLLMKGRWGDSSLPKLRNSVGKVAEYALAELLHGGIADRTAVRYASHRLREFGAVHMCLSCNCELKEAVSQFTVAKTSSFAIVRPAILRSRPVTVNGGVSRRGGTEYAVSAWRAQVIPRQGWHSGWPVKPDLCLCQSVLGCESRHR